MRALREELDSAAIVDTEGVPPDVVTLVSTTRLCDSRRRYEDSSTLVNAEDVAITDGHLTVLAPIVPALLGYRVGDDVYWTVPGGSGHCRNKEPVFQLEQYDLSL